MHATGATRVPCVLNLPKEGVSCVMQTERGELVIEGMGGLYAPIGATCTCAR